MTRGPSPDRASHRRPPRWHDRLRLPLAALRRFVPRHLRRGRADRDLDAEIQAHLAIDARTRMDDGASPEAAWTAARRDFGSVPLVKETTRETWGGVAVARMGADVREGIRRLARQRTFTAAVVIILALGIGTTVAALAVINAAFFERLPVEAPDRLVWFADPTFSYTIVRGVQERAAPIFSGLFAWTIKPLAAEWDVERAVAAIVASERTASEATSAGARSEEATSEGAALEGAALEGRASDGAARGGAAAEAAPASSEIAVVQALFVTETFYPTLRLSAARGRLLDARDVEGAERLDALTAIISDDCWTRRFGRDPAIVGRRIRVERVPVTIVGVTPPGFSGIAPGFAPEITLPLRALPALKPQEGNLQGMAWLHLMGRLRDGLSRAQANAALQTFWPDVMQLTTDPSDPPARRAQFLARRTSLRAGDAGFSPARDRLTRPLAVLLGLVCLFLLVGCASVASLLLVRGVSRQREMAIRLALGGTRARIARLLLIEGALLALLATAVATVIAHWSAQAIVALLSTPARPLVLDLSPDARVAGLTVVMALLTAVLFSLAPGLQAWKIQPGPALKAAVKPVHQGIERRPLGRALVIVEVALATLLLAGAALLTRSVQRLVALDPGFEIARLLIVDLDDSAVRRQAGGRAFSLAWQRTLRERLRAVPGVDAVGLSWMPPVSRDEGAWTSTVMVDRHPSPLPEAGRTFFNFVSPGYFAAVGQTLRRGRDFTPRDQAMAAPPTCVISEALARVAFPRQDPIGRTISIGRDPSRQHLTIVGVVEDAKYQRLQEETRPIAYLPLRDATDGLPRASLVANVRTRLPPPALVEPIRHAVHRLDPSLLVRVEPLADRVRDSLVAERMMATLSVVAGALASFLAATGLYGLLAYAVSSRTGEIGVRMALGARASSVRWMVLRDSLRLSGLGLIAGLGVALAAGRGAAGSLSGLTPADRVGALALAAAVTLAVIVAASLVPAYRASRVDPLQALRHE